MATRFRMNYAETGDVIEPQWWNRDHNELVSEFNGYLDRDHFGVGGISSGELVNESCVRVVMENIAAPTFVPDATILTWQGGTSLNQGDLTSATDCLLEIEWSGSWQWSGAAYSGDAGTAESDCIEFRILVDGETIAQSGPVDDGRLHDSLYLCGAIPVTQGAHDIRVECRVSRRKWFGLTVLEAVTNAPTINERTLLVIERKR